MPLLSYAQNGEDVVLHRALKDVEVGHYIDVGAHDPEVHSVTKIFYDRGWSGINVEASKPCFDRLATARTRDRNLHVAMASRAGMLRFHEVHGTGLSTLEADAASDAEHRGFAVEVVDVPALSLADICRGLPFETTHFLKIDVEGAEHDVLLGADFKAFRPWIVVVEATRPLTTERTDAQWRNILECADYDCTLFDGLNLYFLAREHAHLRDGLSAPANVLDDFIPAHVEQLRAAHDAAAAEVGRLGREIEARDTEMRSRAAENATAAASLAAGREAGTVASAGEQARFSALMSERDMLDRSLRQAMDDVIEARVTLRAVTSTLERELEGVRRQASIDAEHHFSELSDAREQLARLAHFRARSDRLRQISDLTSSGSHLADRGAELMDLRAGLLRQARAWQEEVQHLEGRLGEALERTALLHGSTSWRITSPLRGIRRATHALRREPHRLPGLIGRSALALVARPSAADVIEGSAAEVGLPVLDTGTQALLSVAASLDKEMALIADLLASVSTVIDDEATQQIGPFYSAARLDEQLTRWILSDVVRQRNIAL